jgi:isoleucyl-tRNA synthetase
VWDHVPGTGKAASVHLTEFPEVRTELLDEGLGQEWERLLAARDQILKALEAARKDRQIGSAQEASVEVRAAGEEYEFLAGHQEALETISIVSRLTVQRWVAPRRNGRAGLHGPRGPGAGRQVPAMLELPGDRGRLGRAPGAVRSLRGRAPGSH